MYLTTTSQSIELLLSGAVATTQLPFAASYGEVASDNSTSAPKANHGTSNSTTAVTVVAAPGASLVRQLLRLSVYNADTAAATVTIRTNDGGTTRNEVKVTMQAGEALYYDGSGWYTLDVNGNRKTTATATGAATGDLSGSYPNPTVAKINGSTLGSTTPTSGNVLVGQGSSWVTEPVSGDLTLTNAGVATIPNGTVTQAKLAQESRYLNNYLINGDFRRAIRFATPTNSNIVGAGSYGPDRWLQEIDAGLYSFQQVDNRGGAESGITAAYYSKFINTSAGSSKSIWFQKLSGERSSPLLGSSAIFQIKAKASASTTLHIAFLQLNSSGTVDTFSGSVKNTWSTTAGSDPTWNTNIALVGSAASCSVTTAWQAFNVTATMPTNAKNLIVAVWTDAQLATNAYFALTECGLYLGSQIRDWNPRPPAEEDVLCLPYARTLQHCVAVAQSTTILQTSHEFEPPMRASPSITAQNALKFTDVSTASFTQSSANATIDEEDPKGARISLANFTGLTANRPYLMQNDDAVGMGILFTAEL